MKTTQLLFISMLISFSCIAQDWKLVFSSRVEKNDKGFGGATINLLSSSGSVVQQATSDASGFFKLDIPASGDYNVVVTKDGYVSKTIQISTTGVPADKNKDNFKNGLTIESISLFEPLQGVDYSGLSQPVLHVKYQSATSEFSDDEAYTTKMQAVLQKIRAQEKQVLDQYEAAVKGGDDAFKKKSWTAAKDAYEKALSVLMNKDYPKEQLAKLEQAKKADEEAKKAAAEKIEADRLAKEKAAAEKAIAEKATAEKMEAERLAKEKAAAEKTEAVRIAKEKVAAEKIENEKIAAEKAEANRLAKEKAAAEKMEADRIAQEKANAEKAENEKVAAEKAEANRLAKEKASAEKTEADRIAQEKANAEKSEQEKVNAEKAETERLAKEKTEADRIAQEKANAEKSEQEKVNAEKAETERLAKEKSAAEKMEADRIAQEKSNIEKTEQEKVTVEKTEVKPVALEKQTDEKSSLSPSPVEPVSLEARGRSAARHSIAPLLDADKYKDALTKAESYYKMKRYTEAKVAYENVLKLKPEDMYCKGKLATIEKLSVK